MAMRLAQFIEAAAWDFEVIVAVVPVAGTPPGGAGLAVPTVLVGGPSLTPVGVAMTTLLANPTWRRRLSDATPFPWAARRAPPTMAPEVTRAVGELRPMHGAPVHVLRSYLGPLGLAVAERLGAPWTTLDLDDDDEAFHAANGDTAEAAAYRRLVATFGPSFACLAAASPDDAGALQRRHGLSVSVLPNTVQPPTRLVRAPDPTPDLLFVGNLLYSPNAVAAKVLAETILPAVRSRSGLPVTATIVGNYSGDEAIARLATHPGVRLPGFVEDLQPLYDRATVAVVPLQAGSGTKIKLLEAFANQVPVVTTPAGVAGLGVESGVHLLVTEDEDQLVSHTVTLLRDPASAHRLAAAAAAYVGEHHFPERTRPIVRAFLAAAAARGGGVS